MFAVGTIVGARLGHCFFYEPAYYLANPAEILKVWHGGSPVHGAAIGILLALWLFVRKEKKPYIWAIDRVVIVVALAGALIRLGNLMNSEIYGVETTLPWGFVFLRNHETAPKHPTQIYESLAYLITFGVLFRIYWKNKGKQKPGLLFGLFLIMVFGFRFLVEYVKEDQVSFGGRHEAQQGQWLSIPFILAGIGLLVWAYRKSQFLLRRERRNKGLLPLAVGVNNISDWLVAGYLLQMPLKIRLSIASSRLLISISRFRQNRGTSIPFSIVCIAIAVYSLSSTLKTPLVLPT